MNIKDIPKKKWFIILSVIWIIIGIIWYFFPFNWNNKDWIVNNWTINSQNWNGNVLIDNRIINYSEDKNNINDVRATRYSPKSWILKYTNDSNKNIKDLKWYVYFRKENWWVVEMQNIDLGNINSKDEKELSLFCNPKLPIIVGTPGNIYKELEAVCFEYQNEEKYYSTVNYHDKLSYDFNDYKTYSGKCVEDDYYKNFKNSITESWIATNIDIDNLPPWFKEQMLDVVSKCEN
ncbi:MAG: hypothetical protein ACD_49C00083G0002 [uncultured bacterium (gcode 4)]|uniref:Uncharacterized protein n=1 Tax=uncultured bacterium (gcode 4) TaxID=1234023 RepID=K2ACU1_9BACT|nr:MAG: hypothetical protein ACD_49C00083G0002 [uncultured bacterium (gcode 4)]